MNIKLTRGREKTRHLVRVRDDFTCQDCGFRKTNDEVEKYNKTCKGLKERIKNLDIHHINGLCGKKSRKYDKVSDIDGLITLCHKCHYNRSEHRCKSVEFAGGVCGRPSRIGKDKYPEIKKMRKDRYTLREIGEKFGVGGERIRQILLTL